MKISHLKKYMIIISSIWTLIIALLIIFELTNIKNETVELVKTQARANFDKDQAIRFWAASHGGVYAPVDSITLPNPYLSHIKERDIETPSGKKLTLINPAYLTRQLYEQQNEKYGIAGHLTSLKLLNKNNKPDEWEEAALKQFEKGSSEISKIVRVNDEKYLRLMKPLKITKACLQCHEHQGYKINDIRGGISVAIPMKPIIKQADKKINRISISFGLLCFTGIIALFLGYNDLKTQITKREQGERALRKSEKELYELNATKDKFFSIISHDLKSPFGSILGASELLLRNHKKYDTAKKEKFLKSIYDSSSKAYKLVENLLLWSGMQSNGIKFKPGKVNISTLINENIMLIQNQANDKKINLSAQNNDIMFAYADTNMINIVLRNLISNAIKFTPESGKIKISIKNAGSFLQISVSDNGVGIANENISKLFRIEENYSTEGTNKEQGTGLGLILCKEFIEKQGGKIWVESEVGKGSNFIFTLAAV